MTLSATLNTPSYSDFPKFKNLANNDALLFDSQNGNRIHVLKQGRDYVISYKSQTDYKTYVRKTAIGAYNKAFDLQYD